MRKLLAATLLALLPLAAHAGDKPLVIESGQIKVLPAGTTLQLNASGSGAAPLNIGSGTAPSSPNNGDCWITTSGLFCRYNGGTVGPFGTGTGSGSVTTTGSPASGNLTKFSGSTSITNGDLSGDCTTSSTLAITCTKTNGTSFATSATTDTTNASNISSGTLGSGRLPNPSASTLGGIESLASSSHNFINQISTSGVPSAARPACADLSDSAASCATDATNATNIGSGTLSDSRLNSDVVITGNNNTFTKAQRSTPVTITISTATFTPNFDTGQNFTITLVHASCPCTLANPSTTLVPGQSGVIEIIQSSTGSDTITTWGSSYYYAGGTSTISLSTGANDPDYLSYYVDANSHILLTTAALNATH